MQTGAASSHTNRAMDALYDGLGHMQELAALEGEPPAPREIDPHGEQAGAARKLYEFLADVCWLRDLPVLELDLGADHYGFYHRLAEFIAVSRALTISEKAATLCHELSHSFLRSYYADNEPDVSVKEVQAEGASFVACGYFGLDTSAYSFPYIAAHVTEQPPLEQAMDGLRYAAARILEHAGKRA